MVDEAAFRATLERIDTLPCAFSRALLSAHAECRHARHHHLAERVDVGCLDSAHQALCHDCVERLRREARFALDVADPHARLTHGQAMKLQVGILAGLRRLLAQGTDGAATADVAALFADALSRYGTLVRVPSEVLVREIANFVPRRLRGRH